MSFKDSIKKIAREEAEKAVVALLATVNRQDKCATLGVVTAVDFDTGKATVLLKDGSILQASISGNKPVGIGSVVPLLGSIIV